MNNFENLSPGRKWPVQLPAFRCALRVPGSLACILLITLFQL